MHTKPSQLFLSSNRILEHYFHNDNAGLDNEELSSFLFLDFHSQNNSVPDHIFKNILRDFIDDNATIKSIIFKALEEISDAYIYFRNKKVFIKKDAFEEWQNTITQISPLAAISFAIYNKSKESFRLDCLEFISETLRNTALPSIYDIFLEELINKEGLIDIHVHIGGISEADYLWQNALSHSSEFYQNLRKSFRTDVKNNRLKDLEQYLQLSNLMPSDFYRLLKKAALIRDSLLRELSNYNKEDSDDYLLFPDEVHPMRIIDRNRHKFNAIQYEALFLVKIFQHIEFTANNNHVTRKLHYYLLIYSLFNKLLLQQLSQVGFDQFQKTMHNKWRGNKTPEKKYFQLQGMYNNDLIKLEGRFAPKNKRTKTEKILRLIIKSYKKNKYPSQNNTVENVLSYDLSLVCHFLKLEDRRYMDKESIENIITFRDLDLRIRLAKNLDNLLSIIKIKKFGDYITGFDAAGSELLHAGPEVFSPTFRKLRFLGFNNFTFHAGEDFIHLISGIRTIYEVIEFLEFKEGDRIGHGTAIGILPSLWLERIGNKILIEEGEWLDNLIFVYYIINNYNIGYNNILFTLEQHIKKHFKKIYCFNQDNKIFDTFDIIESWKIRKYDPFITLGWRSVSIFDEFYVKELNEINNHIFYKDRDYRSGKYYNFESAESRRYENKKNADNRLASNADYGFEKTKAFAIFRKYHEGKTIIKYKRLIEINPSELFDADLLTALQKTVLNELIKKNIAIEALPTSNLRISYYNNYSEHHIFRWLNVGFSDLPTPIVCVGSDDPGVFATNARNEFSHILLQLLKKGVNINGAMDIIKNLALNNSIFLFKRSEHDAL